MSLCFLSCWRISDLILSSALCELSLWLNESRGVKSLSLRPAGSLCSSAALLIWFNVPSAAAANSISPRCQHICKHTKDYVAGLKKCVSTNMKYIINIVSWMILKSRCLNVSWLRMSWVLLLNKAKHKHTVSVIPLFHLFGTVKTCAGRLLL